MNVYAPTKPASNPAPSPAAPPAPRHEARLLPALRAVVVKELRIGLPIATVILGLIGFVVMVAHWMRVLYPEPSRDASHMNVLVEGPYASIDGPLAAFIGLILGFVQARAARGSEHWAFLMHRPIRRGYLFLGRAVASFILYGIAAGVPAAVLLVYAANSKGVPYHWRMSLPVLADLAGGFVYVFAGMLAVERRAFIATRVMPIVALVIMSLAAFSAVTFAGAMGIVVLAAVVLGMAALGAHVSDGNALRAPAATHAATVVTLFLGLTVVMVVVMQMGMSIVRDVANNLALDMPRAVPPRYKSATQYLFLPDGTLGRQRFIPEPPASSNADVSAAAGSRFYLPLDSEIPLDPQPTPPQFAEIQSHSVVIGSAGFQTRYRDKVELNDLMAIRVVSPNPQPSEELWYIIPSADVIEGYDAKTQARLGSIGVDGFAPPGSRAHRFSYVSGQNAYSGRRLFLGPKGIYSVNLHQRTVIVQDELPAGTDVMGLATGLTYRNQQGVLLVRAHDRVFVFEQEAIGPDRLIVELPLAGPMSPYIKVTNFRGAGADADKGNWGVADGSGLHNQFDIFDASGKLLSHHQFASMLEIDPPIPPMPENVRRIRNELLMASGMVDAVGNLPAVATLYAVLDVGGAGNEDVPPNTNPWYLVGAAVVGAISAAGAFMLARRYRLRLTLLWSLAALAFGPLVLLVLICTHNLPRREPCPTCGRRRFVAEVQCRHCHGEFPLPAPSPAEIFA